MSDRVTFGDIMGSGKWDEFCDMRGYDSWFINEGRGDMDDDANLTAAESLVLAGIKTKQPEDQQAETHTPGPWAVEYKAQRGRNAVTRGDHWIATVGISTITDGSPDANARLIAAAPESYDALRQYVSATDNEDPAELANAYESAKLAIAKIEGRD